jgi:arabinogalactan oligomer / maltooligosaccharide transport system permease protein
MSAPDPAPALAEAGTEPSSPTRSPQLPGFPAQAGGAGTVVKYVALALVNALALWALPTLVAAQAWTFLVFLVVATAVIDWAYIGRRNLPAKYLVPGTIFLVAFQIYPVLYTGYLAFTNYGTGNNLTREQAIEGIQAGNLIVPPDAVRYVVVPYEGPDGEPALLLTDPDGNQFLGTAETFVPFEEAGEGYTQLNLRDVQDRQAEFQELRIPTEDGEVGLETFSSAVRRVARYQYDEAADTMTDTTTGDVYRPVEGRFTNEAGESLNPGWIAPIGWDNFARIFTSRDIQGPFLRVFLWTFAFAALSVLLVFTVGLGLAITLNDERMRSRRLYRSLLIIPYALPSFLSALIWAALFNTDFGQINRMLGADIPWFENGLLAKIAVLVVNTWLGFPYMFLVTTGALQSIPGEVLEAAKVDGASAWNSFRRVTLPLLLVSIAPVLISTFAFNFNNFNVIYLLTRGNPPFAGTPTPAGQTDILITYAYRLAFAGGSGQDFGFAAAISVIIFLLVGAISYVSFRQTRTLEEVN